MVMALDPTKLPVGRVVGQFALVSADTNDAGWEPQFTGVVGTVLFTCTATPLPIRFIDTGHTIGLVPTEVAAQFDSEGNLIGVDGEPLVLLATDSVKLNPTDFNWKVTFNLTDVTTGKQLPLPSFEFQVPEWAVAGDEVDLAEVFPVGSSGGVLITRGASAYEVAVENGFVGTEAEWLDSLNGTGGGGGGSSAWADITGKPATFPPTIGATGSTAVAGNDTRLTNARTPLTHSHAIADTTGLQAALDSKGTSNLALGTSSTTAKAGDYQPTWTQVTSKPTVFDPTTHTHAMTDVTGLSAALTGKAAATHTHAIADTSGLQAALDAASGGGGSPAWDNVTGKPTTFPPTIGSTAADAVAGNDARLTNARTPSAHTHPISEVTSLQAALDAKAVATDVTTALAGKSDTSHTHAYADVTGKPTTFAPIVGTGAADAKAGNYVPTYTEITGKPTTFAPTIGATATTAVAGNDARLTDARTPVAHTQAASTISDSTTVGRAVLTAVDAAAARAATGAGTSSLALGTTSTTAKAGDYQPAWTDVTSKPSTFAPTIGATATTAVAGNDARLTDARTPTTHTHAIADTTGLQAALDAKALATSVGAKVVTIMDGSPATGLAVGTVIVRPVP